MRVGQAGRQSGIGRMDEEIRLNIFVLDMGGFSVDKRSIYLT